MTAHSSTETAVQSIKKGASDYLNKPVKIGPLRARIGKLIEEARKRERSLPIEDDFRNHSTFEGIVGRNPQMCEMLSRIRRAAAHYRTVLITGETGTGKDLVARALHRLSPVASGPYVIVNCSVETLFESELFGHVKGSFTGATKDKPGLFEHAPGGTLFLDEIDDMPLATQAKLLRVLQNQELQRVGALHARKVDVRVVAASNHNLSAAIAQKRFREDLYYRLSMVEIRTPRLADRKNDLPLLERHIVARFAALYGKQIRGLTERAQIRLLQHSCPGNVRELENVIGCAAMMTTSDMIDVQELPPHLQTRAVSVRASEGDVLEGQERLLIMPALETSGGNQTEAARILSISRDRFRYKLKKHNLYMSDSGRLQRLPVDLGVPVVIGQTQVSDAQDRDLRRSNDPIPVTVAPRWLRLGMCPMSSASGPALTRTTLCGSSGFEEESDAAQPFLYPARDERLQLDVP